MFGAERVIAIDRMPERLRLAQEKVGAAAVINYEEVNLFAVASRAERNRRAVNHK